MFLAENHVPQVFLLIETKCVVAHAECIYKFSTFIFKIVLQILIGLKEKERKQVKEKKYAISLLLKVKITLRLTDTITCHAAPFYIKLF